MIRSTRSTQTIPFLVGASAAAGRAHRLADRGVRRRQRRRRGAGGSTLATQSGGGGGAAPATPGKPASLDTAEAVIEASLAAQGGRALIGQVKAIRQIGTFALPRMGMTGSMMSVATPPRNAARPRDPRRRQDQPGRQRRRGVGDEPDHRRARDLGDERAQLLRESTFGGDLIWKQLFPKAELAAAVEFAGQPAYKVVLTAADGDAQTRYFAKDTLLPLGVETMAKTQMGKMPVTMEMSDWREVGGVKYAHRLQRREGRGRSRSPSRGSRSIRSSLSGHVRPAAGDRRAAGRQGGQRRHPAPPRPRPSPSRSAHPAQACRAGAPPAAPGCR